MNHKRLAVCLFSMLIVGMYGCDEGKYNNLRCNIDEDKPECIDARYIMTCDPATQTFEVTSCDPGFVCTMSLGDAVCVKDPNARPVCSDGDKQCSGDTVQTCNKGFWETATQPCENGCEKGVCKETSDTSCTENETRCSEDGVTIQTCTDGKEWNDTEFCESGCENGACKTDESCTEEATQCSEDATTVQTCKNGTWVDATEPCENGCENGACIIVEPCTEDATQCAEDGTTVQTCKNGTWVDATEPCENGCENGACIIVEPCTEETTQCAEDGTTVQTCKNGTWVDATEPCENGCTDGACIIVEPCTEETTQCAEDGTTVQTCKNGTWVDATEPCENGCADGACIEGPVQPCTEETKQCNSDGTTVQTCTDSVWVDDPTPCEFGCEDGVCKEPPVDICNIGDMQCSDDETALLECIGSEWIEKETCTFGCMEGVCLLGSDCLPGEMLCKADGNTLQICDLGVWVDAMPCEFGCEGGVCFPEACGNHRIDEGEDCDGELLGGKACGDVVPMSTGELGCDYECHYDTYFCALPQEDTPCDPATFIESCNDAYPVYCKPDAEDPTSGTVVHGADYCDSYEGLSCVVFGEGTSAHAQCVHTTDDVCTLPEEVDRCGYVNDENGDEVLASMHFVCTQANDGNAYYEATSQTICEGTAPSCLSDTHLCGQLVENEGTECPDDFAAHCDTGEIVVTCHYDAKQDLNVIAAESCASGQICAMDDGSPNCYEPCTVADETIVRCEDSYSMTYVCTSLGDKLVYIQTDSAYCAHGCDTSEKTCLVLSEHEGDHCDYASYQPQCDGTDVQLTCSNYRDEVVAMSCNLEYLSGYVCVEGECLEPCETVGDIKYACTYDGTTQSRKYVCTQDGEIKYWREDASAIEICETNECQPELGKCIAACDQATFAPRCDGNIPVNCYYGLEEMRPECEINNGVCRVLDIEGDVAAYCLDSAEECPAVADPEPFCGSYFGANYQGERACRASTDGKNYYYFDAYLECEGECDTEGKYCAE